MLILIIIISIWIFIWIYNGFTGRHFAQDIVPVILLPLIALLPIKYLIKKMRKPLSGERTYLPVSWQSLIKTASVQRRLLPGREVVLGHNDFRVVYASLDDARHLLITGITGEGKTTIALNIVQSLLIQGPGIFSKMTFSLHDAKNVTALHYKILADMYPNHFQIHTQVDNSLEALRELVDEMMDRTKQLGDKLLFDIDDLALPHRLILIDEPQLFYRRSAEYERLVLELVTTGRQAGFHLVLMTPYSKSTIISTDYRPNFRYISGFLPRHAEVVVQMPVSKLPRYHFLYQTSERDAAIRFTPYKMAPGDIQEMIGRFGQTKTTGEEVAWHIFKTTPNCGVRTLLREGRRYCEVECDDIPFPFSEVRGDRWSAAAWQWGQQFLRELAEQGKASDALPGQARRVLA